MTWFKVDDTLHSHPKAIAAGPAAMGLWVMAGAYAAAYKLDGQVPDRFVATIPQGRKLAAKLVDVRLWDTQPGGWIFRDWDDYQPSSTEIEKRRAIARERQRRHRSRGDDPTDPVHQADADVTHLVTRDNKAGHA